jgi:hypothetical protein
MGTGDRPVVRWTAVLRRQPARVVDGEPEGGCTDMFEIICCDAVTIPAWITSRSRPGSSWSAALTR